MEMPLAIILQLSNLEVQLQQLSTPTQTQATTPVDCGDFFGSLCQHKEKEKEISHGNIELTQYLNAKTTNNLSSLNSFPNIKILYSRYNTGLLLQWRECSLWVDES